MRTYKGRAPSYGRSSAQVFTAAKKAYRARDGAQAESLDLFGSPQEWSSAAEHWSLEQWQAISAILFNGNIDLHEFLLIHESANAKERFNKAKRADLNWHIQQSYETVAGKAARRSGIGYYPWNGEARRASYWAAVDFDAHKGQSPERARELAARLVARLKRDGLMAVIACTSGDSGGWHVFMVRREPGLIAEWSKFLRKRLAEIGAVIATPEGGGDCELHPHETNERPRGIRAPGSLNPKDGSFGLIAFDSLTDRLHEWRDLLPAKTATAIKASSPKAAIIVLGELLLSRMCAKYAITAVRTRHKRLKKLVGFAVNHCTERLALKAAAQLYKQAQKLSGETSIEEHLAEFPDMWQRFTRKEVASLNEKERRAYRSLTTDTLRSAFLIMRNWAKTSEPDFYADSHTLAAYLEVSLKRACTIRGEFCRWGFMRMTADYVPHKWSRRYQWLLGEPSKLHGRNGATP